MPTFAGKYLVTEVVQSIPKGTPPQTYINIAGKNWVQDGYEINSDGIHHYVLQGLVDVSTIDINQRNFPFLVPAGGTYYSYGEQVIDNITEIPAQYLISQFGTTGPGGMFSFVDSDHTGVRFGPVSYNASTDVAGSLTYNNLTINTNSTILSLADNAAKAAGFTGLSTAINNVAAVKNALANVVTGGMQLLNYGIKNFSDPYAEANFDAMATQYMNGAAKTFNDALINQTLYPGNPNAESAADAILRAVQMAGAVGPNGAIPLSAGFLLGLEVNVGDIAHATVSYGGTFNVVINPAQGGTFDTGTGNSWLVLTAPSDHTVNVGPGADFVLTGAGNDTFIANPSPPYLQNVGVPYPTDRLDGGAGNNTTVFSGALSAYRASSSGSDKATIYGSEGGTYVTNMETLKFSDGTVSLSDTNPLVDNLYYDQRYSDIFHASADPASHYFSYGSREGRDPNPDFSTIGYLGANRDVKAAGVNPLSHYDQYGWKEGRDPSANFDTTLYLLHNPDVKAAGVDPLAHYLQYGKAEGRQAYAAIGSSITHGSFDAEYYLLANPDVAASGTDPYQHWEEYGWKEGRNPNAYFDTKGYLAAYSDVKAANIDPLAHFDNYGWKEGRDPSGRI